MMTDNLTSQSYWDSMYQGRRELRPVEISGFRNRCDREIFGKKAGSLETAKSVLELGGGASPWIAFLSQRYPEKRFVSIDYSDEGSERLRGFVQHSSIQNVDVVVDDFFSESATKERFDFVYSHGVVEHFTDLREVLRAHSRYLKGDGQMLVIIPNMAGLIGNLTRILNKAVYDVHVPHDLNSLVRGHTDTGLKIMESGYLGSSNFGVLSSCVQKKSGAKWHAYKILSRLSKAVWAFEDKVTPLPTSRVFSPYIYVLSEHKKGGRCTASDEGGSSITQ